MFNAFEALVSLIFESEHQFSPHLCIITPFKRVFSFLKNLKV